MSSHFVKRTQDSLGKVIKKPPLTEKLLSKPPFRYLHDIFTEVIRITGFLKGLYTDFEMKSDNVKDKDAKIAFLQKAIDVVMMVSGDSLSVKPARIVAGHEPEKTNELLQAIAKCCLNKLSSDDSVRRVLTGEKTDPKAKAPSSSKSQGKENREKSDEHKRQKDKELEEKNDNGIKDSSRDRKEKEQSRERGKQMDKERDRHKDGDRRERTKEQERDRAKTKEKDQENHKNRGDGERVEKEKNRGTEKVEKDKIRGDGEKDKERSKERERNRDKEKTREKREKDKREEHEHLKDQSRDQEMEKEKAKEQEKSERRSKVIAEDKPPIQPSEVVKKDIKTDAEQEVESPVRIPRPSSAKGQRRKPKSGVEEEGKESKTSLSQQEVLEQKSGKESKVTKLDVSDVEGDPEAAQYSIEKKHAAEVNGEVTDELSLQAVQSKRIPRPGSARPAPPRVKKQESTDSPPERVSSAKPLTNVIVEQGKNAEEEEEDDDEQFVVEEAVSQLPDMPEMEPVAAMELQDNEDHGGLVKKILETKKDYESSKSVTKHKDQEKTIISETARKKEKELVTKEIEKLRMSIQTLCRSALPLGKIMDYIQEDMDSMQNELSMWRKENKKHAESLLREQSVTDTAVEPLKTELAELEQLIKDQQDKNCAVKANILKNEDKIQKMISSINFTSRT
ncbi:TRAF3-interacting protein 1 isoform X1 [Leucoraja erinacea]|uniref:TRAF3-interacting protein 1 isoform X1 n=2 Tax=Leucoraja erinaceus TaxID=7782 RepID=UPI00245889C4|nr:TRAF3-interacting protein 1 isoform X1 [Leucoraja erinacea]